MKSVNARIPDKVCCSTVSVPMFIRLICPPLSGTEPAGFLQRNRCQALLLDLFEPLFRYRLEGVGCGNGLGNLFKLCLFQRIKPLGKLATSCQQHLPRIASERGPSSVPSMYLDAGGTDRTDVASYTIKIVGKQPFRGRPWTCLEAEMEARAGIEPACKDLQSSA